MEVKIRGIDPQYIQEIDRKVMEIRQKTNRNFSRNDYLKMLLRQDSEIDLINYKKAEFDLALDKMLVSNEELTASIENLTDVYERLFNLLLSEGGR
ncbi:hypothetical protein JZO71_04015 [Enterococcus sp. MSG2901]|uniref:Control of competence regulator ComK, YlbF/YmcA n=1 Tax=Candidatus Enterococcus courvalinii TaxID=2815329 RepID=A0ABS3HYF8_9ENTE|nr:hypothetical protein [Enterococcus sp. MSG2901]MBO0481490.1 hypothetical protein [Enterococcus sp. MSG2901]